MIKGIVFDLGGVYLNRGIKITFIEKFAKMFNLSLEGDNRFQIFANFDAIAISGYEGIEKPNPKIYHLLLKKLRLKANECVFVDDQKSNLGYPAEIGMKTVLYENPQQLHKELKVMEVEF